MDELKKKEAKKMSTLDNRERVALTDASIQKLDNWVRQVTSKRTGVTLNRKQLVNALIEYHASTLSLAEEAMLAAQFYDEVKFLAQALQQLRRARARGEDLRLEALLKPVLAGAKTSAVKKEPRKTSAAPVAVDEVMPEPSAA